MNKIIIQKRHIEEIISHARESFPLEACGIMAGKRNIIHKIIRAKNKEQSDISYSIDPVEQLKIFEKMDKLKLELAGIYHSHPAMPAYPSKRDIKLACYHDAAYFIISVKESNETEVKAFKIQDKKAQEIKIKILENG